MLRYCRERASQRLEVIQIIFSIHSLLLCSQHSLLYIVAYIRFPFVLNFLHLCLCELCTICPNDFTSETPTIGATSSQLEFIMCFLSFVHTTLIVRFWLSIHLRALVFRSFADLIIADVNGLGTRCSLFSRIFLFVFC